MQALGRTALFVGALIAGAPLSASTTTPITVPPSNIRGITPDFGFTIAANNGIALISDIGARYFETVVGPGTITRTVDIGRAGIVYAYDLNTGHAVGVFEDPDPNDDDGFGFGLALNETVALIGAPGLPLSQNPNFDQGGYAYIMDRTTGEVIFRLADNFPQMGVPQIGNGFGTVVAMSDTLAVVSAPDYREMRGGVGVPNAGRSFVFDIATGNLVSTIVNPETDGDKAFADNFTSSVAIDGDRVIHGAPVNDPTIGAAASTAPGQAYVFDANTGELLRRLENPSPATIDGFGTSVSASDGVVVVGAPRKDVNGARAAGQAFVYDIETGELLYVLENPDPQIDDEFGTSVAFENGRILVGAPNASNLRIQGVPIGMFGQVFVFDALTGNLIEVINNPTPDEFSQFGLRVAFDGQSALVGPFFDRQDVPRSAPFAPDITTTVFAVDPPAAIPVPAALPLLLAALGGFAVLSLRARRREQTAKA